MKKALLLAILISGFVFGQSPEKFEMTAESKGINKFIVTEVSEKTAPEIYQSSLAWIKKTFVGPDQVIIATVENDYIKFQGIASGAHCWKLVMLACTDIKYRAEINIKDGKYKFELLDFEEMEADYSPPYIKRWIPANDFFFSSNRELYGKDGDFKKQYKPYIGRFPEYFNNLNSDLRNYILGKSEKSNKDW